MPVLQSWWETYLFIIGGVTSVRYCRANAIVKEYNHACNRGTMRAMCGTMRAMRQVRFDFTSAHEITRVATARAALGTKSQTPEADQRL